MKTRENDRVEITYKFCLNCTKKKCSGNCQDRIMEERRLKEILKRERV